MTEVKRDSVKRRGPRQHNAQPLEVATWPEALLKLPTVVNLTGISKTTIYTKVASNEFPKPVRIGNRCTRFRARDIVAWLKSQKA